MRARRPHDIRHVLVPDAVALLSHSGGDGPQRLSLRPQGDHFPDPWHLSQWADPLFARRCQPVFNRLPAGEPVDRLSQRLDALAVELWRKNPHP
jgi:hypothetical protein